MLSTSLFSVDVSIRHYKHTGQTVYDLCGTLCESLAVRLDFSPKPNWVKYKLGISGFV